MAYRQQNTHHKCRLFFGLAIYLFKYTCVDEYFKKNIHRQLSLWSPLLIIIKIKYAIIILCHESHKVLLNLLSHFLKSLI
jgi:hypothetical protein